MAGYELDGYGVAELVVSLEQISRVKGCSVRCSVRTVVFDFSDLPLLGGPWGGRKFVGLNSTCFLNLTKVLGASDGSSPRKCAVMKCLSSVNCLQPNLGSKRSVSSVKSWKSRTTETLSDCSVSARESESLKSEIFLLRDVACIEILMSRGCDVFNVQPAFA